MMQDKDFNFNCNKNIDQKKVYENKEKTPILFSLHENYNKRIYDLSKIYRNNYFYRNMKNKNIIIELINDVPLKIYLQCKKETNKEEYNNRYKLLIKFDSILKKFLKNKYKKELKNKCIYYTDISYNKEDEYFIFFNIIISQEIGVFKDINNIKILMKELNNILKNQKDNIFGSSFIDLKLYNKEYYKNIFTYINNQPISINIYNGNINKSGNIYNRYYFINSLIGYYDDITKVNTLDDNIITLDNYFNKLKL